MLNQISIARPYAKALFEHALAKQQLSEWSSWLASLSQIMEDRALVDLTKNAALPREKQAEILIGISQSFNHQWFPEFEHVIRLLAQNQRLNAVSSIAKQFGDLRASFEKTITVNVTTVAPLTSAQEKRLIDSLSRRLNRQVTLIQMIDPSILGGFVVNANDLVIDNSVRGQLTKLRNSLVA